jgi:hypothetical protein
VLEIVKRAHVVPAVLAKVLKRCDHNGSLEHVVEHGFEEVHHVSSSRYELLAGANPLPATRKGVTARGRR